MVVAKGGTAWGCEWKGYATSNVGQNQGESRQVKASRDGDHPNSQHECRLCESPKGDVFGIQPHPDHHDWHAVEDAYRRDLTINSLFYNINTDTIEDFTMRGIDDLAAKDRAYASPCTGDVYRRPVAPPARHSVCMSVSEQHRPCHHGRRPKDPGIESMLSRKVSRERVGIELLKMAQGATSPVRCI